VGPSCRPHPDHLPVVLVPTSWLISLLVRLRNPASFRTVRRWRSPTPPCHGLNDAAGPDVPTSPRSPGGGLGLGYISRAAPSPRQNRYCWRSLKYARFMCGGLLKTWVSACGGRENDFAISRHDLLSPPRMKMWYNSGCVAGPEVVFDISAANLSISRTRIPAGTANCRL
jgi:hypothetical protein